MAAIDVVELLDELIVESELTVANAKRARRESTAVVRDAARVREHLEQLRNHVQTQEVTTHERHTHSS